MAKRLRVLLLSAPIGSGHKLAAEAIKEYLEAEAEVEVVHGDVFSFFPKLLGQSFMKSYLWVLDKCPWFYAWAYSWGNRGGGSLWLRNLINRILAVLGNGYLTEQKPDVVIATHATPAGIISCYKTQHPELRLGVVITDFIAHKWWFCDKVDTYFVAHEKLLEKLPRASAVRVTGIPLRKQVVEYAIAYQKNACDIIGEGINEALGNAGQELEYNQDRPNLGIGNIEENSDKDGVDSKEKLRAVFGWTKEDKVCLLLGGGEGLLPMKLLLEELNGMDKIKLIAVTGRNKALEEQLKAIYSQGKATDTKNSSVNILGYREDLPALMTAADVIITKAGALTASEILALGTRAILYAPLPGQEEGNAQFLCANCQMQIADNLLSLKKQLKEILLENETTASQWRAYYGKPMAAKEIATWAMQASGSE